MSSRWEPFDQQITSLREAMSRLMDQSFLFNRGSGDGGAAHSVPVNIFETDEILLVIAPMPGVQQEDIEITARGNSLTIEGRERAGLKPGTSSSYIRHEWSAGPYRRTVELPYAVDAGSADATLGDGVLTVRLAKAATEKSHKINVKTTV